MEVFEKIYEEDNNSVLILVGTGPLKEKYENIVKNMPYCNNVIFAGVRPDVYKILSAADVLIFPSFYEGVSVTVMEAQANGLYSVVSDVLPNEVKLTDNIVFLSLNEGIDVWKYTAKNRPQADRLQCNLMVKNSAFNIEKVTDYLEDFYVNFYEENL